jgi:hypothetical protein
MVFKKHLTPLSKHGRIVKHRGKGSVQQRLDRDQQEDVTGGDPLARMMNRYPAQEQAAPEPTSAPPLGGPPLGAAPPGGMAPPVDQDAG